MINLTKTQKSFGGKIANFFVAFMFLVLWVKLVFVLYRWMFAREFTMYGQLVYDYSHKALVNVYMFCIAAPVGEEIVFRHLPIQVLKATKKPDLYWPLILFTSVIFAWLHIGEFNLLIQGVIGLSASILYIKNNYSLISAIALHSAWNLCVLLNLFNF